MKIRLTDAEIRLRVTESEYATLCHGHTVAVTVWDSLSFRLLLTDDPQPRVIREEDAVVIVVPQDLVHAPTNREPWIHEFMDHATLVVVELELGR